MEAEVIWALSVPALGDCLGRALGLFEKGDRP